MDRTTVLLVILVCCNLLSDDTVQCIRSSFEKENINMEAKEVKENETTIPPHFFLAVAQTRTSKYAGAKGGLSIHNPVAVDKQYSATRIRLVFGPDSMEAGWRVDPSLYGDSLTRFFIHTDAGESHCFNTHCVGFNNTSEFNLESNFINMSKPGGPTYRMRLLIIRDDTNGNWKLLAGDGQDTFEVGHWPRSMFPNLADRVEWGGEVYSPPGVPLPPMGSSKRPTGDELYDAYISNMEVINEQGQFVYTDIRTYEDDSELYSIQERVRFDPVWGHVVLYGGPPHP